MWLFGTKGTWHLWNIRILKIFMNVDPWEKPRGLACALNPPAQVNQEAVQPVSGCAELGCGIPAEPGSACRFKHHLRLRANLLCVDRKVGAPHWQHFLRGRGLWGVFFFSLGGLVWGNRLFPHCRVCGQTQIQTLVYYLWSNPTPVLLVSVPLLFLIIYTLFLLLVFFTIPPFF